MAVDLVERIETKSLTCKIGYQTLQIRQQRKFERERKRQRINKKERHDLLHAHCIIPIAILRIHTFVSLDFYYTSKPHLAEADTIKPTPANILAYVTKANPKVGSPVVQSEVKRVCKAIKNVKVVIVK